MDVCYNKGLYVTFENKHFMFDPLTKFETAFVSHAHLDHCSGISSSRGANVVASDITAQAMKKKYHPDFNHILETNPNFTDFEFKSLDAGHVMGSRQFFFSNGASFLYTGDINTQDQLSCKKADVIEADNLIIEATWGRPDFVLPDPGVVRNNIISFVEESFKSGNPVIFYAYPMGKAQELTELLQDFNIFVDSSVKEMNDIYKKEHNVKYHFLPEGLPISGNEWVGIFSASRMRENSVLFSKMHETNIPKKVLASGWSFEPWFFKNAKTTLGIDQIFPLSSHSDFPHLMEFIEGVSPKKIYTIFGEKEALAKELNTRGYDAEAVTEIKVQRERTLQKKLVAF